MDLSSLNDNQCKAVQWGEGPLLVLAGPGSGKTRVLTYRISRLIADTPEKHFRILGLTFTNKAAAEMRERVEGLVPNARERVLLTTFHSFCADVLRQHGHHIGLRPDFTILGQAADRQGLLDDAIATVTKEKNQTPYTGERLLPLITRLLDLGIGAISFCPLNSCNIFPTARIAEGCKWASGSSRAIIGIANFSYLPSS